MKTRLWVGIFLIVCGVACAYRAAMKAEQQYIPYEETLPASYDRVWAAVLIVVGDQADEIMVAEKESGLLSFRDDIAMLGWEGFIGRDGKSLSAQSFFHQSLWNTCVRWEAISTITLKGTEGGTILRMGMHGKCLENAPPEVRQVSTGKYEQWMMDRIKGKMDSLQ